MMILSNTQERSFRRKPMYAKEADPTFGQELLSAIRFVFDQPERRLRATDFVWSYEELAEKPAE